MLKYETLNLIDTLIAIKKIKDHFEQRLSKILKLIRVSAPLFVESNKGINDNLNGVEQPVSFKVGNNDIEIVHSLAKWKRMALPRLKTSLIFPVWRFWRGSLASALPFPSH